MEYRRCRKGLMTVLTAAIILSGSAQNVYAAHETSAEKDLFSRMGDARERLEKCCVRY